MSKRDKSAKKQSSSVPKSPAAEENVNSGVNVEEHISQTVLGGKHTNSANWPFLLKNFDKMNVK